MKRKQYTECMLTDILVKIYNSSERLAR